MSDNTIFSKQMSSLESKIALVTGSSRGVGRGIAHELGIQGATVYITGRSRSSGETTDNLPGTIDETAELVTASGGTGIALQCDHTDDEQVINVAEEIKQNHGKLDLLVNNVWGGYEQYDSTLFELPVWEQPVSRWDKMIQTGVRAHYTTTRAVLPLMLDGSNPLIVNISFGDENKFLGDVQYDIAKYAVTRLGFALAMKLKDNGITALTVYPGFTATERVKQSLSEQELEQTHTPRFVGRAVVALASDSHISEKTGKALKVGDLGREYGFTDLDGRQPEPFTLP